MTRFAPVLAATAFLAVLSAGPARSAQVTWSFSGTADVVGGSLDYFPNGTPYSVSITYESSAPPTAIDCCGGYTYDSLLSVTFDSPTYHPTISLLPPNQSEVHANGTFLSFKAGAPSGATSSNPGFLLQLGDLTFNPAHLPIAPPPAGISGGAYLNLFVDTGPGAYIYLYANVPISSIQHSVPEPAAVALMSLFASVLALRRLPLRR